MSKIKRAIIIAAGIGKRMRPVTLDTPKPLIKVNGKRIIENTIELLTQNGVEEIYIVAGYKKEQFEKVFFNKPNVHIVENPYYLDGNNITSLYQVREYLPESFVLEGDIIIKDASVLDNEVLHSGYIAAWNDQCKEWLLDLEDGVIKNCQISGEGSCYQLYGISLWNKEDGECLASLIEQEYNNKNWGMYWDEIPLFKYKDKFELHIREISSDALMEIDTFDELVAIDKSYENYERKEL